MANGIKIGNLDISSFKVGSADTKVYLGDTLLYPTTPPSFQGKWLATYTGGTTSSAECDASSAITQNEITLTDLVSAEIGDCVTSIGNEAFSRCSNLTSCTIGNSVTSIGYEAFERCLSLTSIDIPSGVTSIGDSAFLGCSSLASIDIPSGVTIIGDNVFRNCTSLTSIDIPSGVTSIGERAFMYCSSLTSIDIPSGVTSIGYEAFEVCRSLTSCTIGSGVTSIGNLAFDGCGSLTSITIEAVTPPTLGDRAFSNTNNCPIYVPSASVNAYKAASGWSTYASRIRTWHAYSQYYFTIVSLSDNNAISYQNSAYTTTVAISYSTDNGSTWTDATASQNTTVSLATLNTNDRMLVKGTNDTLGGAYNKFTRFNATGDFNVEGNTMSLLYGDNFSGQTTFVSGNSTWFPMLFSYNTHIINAENLVLPATDLLSPKPTGTSGAYNGMFRGCSNLLTAPQLPAITLNQQCYASMFEGCTSLRVAPELPATTLANNCYQKMFCMDRTNPTQAAMTVAPELPATTLSNKCYMEMFLNNASLTTAPSSIGDSSTTMVASGCTSMFSGCTSLTTAPELPATTLASYCYNGMFQGCTSLNSITCLATNISASNCTTNWVNGVSSSGTFTKASSMSSWSTGNSGIPSGWSVQNYS